MSRGPLPNSKRSRPVGTYVALLRGINVGGKNKVSMRELVTMFTGVGCTDVRTYIQSGNVVFGATTHIADRLPDLAERAIARRFGHRIPIVLRTADELAAVVANNPFIQPGIDTDALQVMFLADQPSAHSVEGLDSNRSPPDSFAVHGREIYLQCPNGFAQTKLTNAYFDTKLATTSTGRNWRTVMKLLELVEG
jgi:uncharacterized protein (DUF1697 family)